MNKTELVNAVRETYTINGGDIPRTHCDKIVTQVFSTIQDMLREGEDVVITGFGSFKVKEVAARTGRNPHTGATLEIPSKKKVVFKPGKNLKEIVQ